MLLWQRLRPDEQKQETGTWIWWEHMANNPNSDLQRDDSAIPGTQWIFLVEERSERPANAESVCLHQAPSEETRPKHRIWLATRDDRCTYIPWSIHNHDQLNWQWHRPSPQSQVIEKQPPRVSVPTFCNTSSRMAKDQTAESKWEQGRLWIRWPRFY